MKNALWMSLLIPLIFSLITTQTVATNGTLVWVDPSYYEAPSVGNSFSVTVKINDVTGLFAYEIKLWYNTTLLNATSITLPTGHFLTPSDPSNLYIAKKTITDNYNATHGLAWVGITLLAPETPKTGSGTLFKVDFISTAMGGSYPLILKHPVVGYSESDYPVKLAPLPPGLPIPCQVEKGSVKVVPEFPIALLMPLFIIITLVSVILGRGAWLKKRRSSFVAN